MALSKITNASVADTAVHGRRNLLINGAMQVHQRGDQSVSSGSTYGLDRWQMVTLGGSGSAAYDLQQSTDTPANQGFSNSFKIDVTTADTAPAAADGYLWRQQLEGQDVQHLCKGTSNAKTLTLQFWIKSSKTGTYVVELYDLDNTRQVSASYTVNTADTWEKKVITYPADTSGTLDNDNNRSLLVQFWLMAGSNHTSGTLNTSWAGVTNVNRIVGQVNALDSASNNIYFTGLQLEVGDTATPFEHRSFGEELALCQRYLCKSAIYSDAPANSTPYNGGCIGGSTSGYNSTTAYTNFTNYPVSMRAKPTITIYSANLPGNADGKASVYDGGWGSATTTILSNSEIGHALNIVDSWTAHNTVMYFYGYKAEAEL